MKYSLGWRYDEKTQVTKFVSPKPKLGNKPWRISRGGSSGLGGKVEVSVGGGLGEEDMEEEDSGVVVASLWEPLLLLLLLWSGTGARWPSGTSRSWQDKDNKKKQAVVFNLCNCFAWSLFTHFVCWLEETITLCCVCSGWQINMASSSWLSPSTLQRRRGTSVDRGARGMGIGCVWRHINKCSGIILHSGPNMSSETPPSSQNFRLESLRNQENPWLATECNCQHWVKAEHYTVYWPLGLIFVTVLFKVYLYIYICHFCVFIHKLSCSVLVYAGVNEQCQWQHASILLFWIPNGTFSTRMWRHP